MVHFEKTKTLFGQLSTSVEDAPMALLIENDGAGYYGTLLVFGEESGLGGACELSFSDGGISMKGECDLDGRGSTLDLRWRCHPYFPE